MPDAPEKPLAKPADFEPWLRKNFEALDQNKDGGIDTIELFRAYRKPNMSTTDSAMVLAMFEGFTLVDKQGKKDGKISLDDAAALSKKVTENKDPDVRQKWHEAVGFGNERVSQINHKLWGEFKNPKDAIKPDAVGQGLVGDCWFMAAVAAVADAAPTAIEKMIEQTPDGKYKVTFPGLPQKPVTVEPPTTIELAMFAKGTKYGAWVAVIEKAASQLGLKPPAEDQIKTLNGGDPATALELLTGCKTTRLEGDEINVRQKLALAHQWGLPIVCSSKREGTDKENDERGVYFTHAYSAKYDPRDRKVEVRNPWGWVKGSEPSLPDGRPIDGVADGAFKMSIDDFRKSFWKITVVMP